MTNKELDKVMLTEEEIREAYIKACSSNELCDETNGSRGVAKAQLAKARPIIAEEILKDVKQELIKRLLVPLAGQGMSLYDHVADEFVQALKERYQGEKK